MGHINIRELQKLSAETIGALRGRTAVKSGNRTVGLLIPLKAANPDRLAEVLAKAEALAKERDPKEDEELLGEFDEVDPMDWSIEGTEAFIASQKK